MRKIFFTFIATLLIGLSGINTPVMAAPSNSQTSTPSSSSTSCDASFLGLVPWYSGLDMDGDCNIQKPTGDDGITKYIVRIVLNILVDISLIIGYVAIAIIAWGGYLYLFSKGEVGRAEKGRKTLVSAAIGLLIALLASVIMRFFSTVLIQ